MGERGRTNVWGKGGGKGRRREAFGFSQRCDMFVMFSHWGDAQTFHFSVWHLHQAAKCGTADTAPDEGTLQGDKSHQNQMCDGVCASLGLYCSMVPPMQTQIKVPEHNFTWRPLWVTDTI